MALRTFVFAKFLAIALSQEVFTLTGKNFDQHLRETPQTLVEFYAPWCGHCKKLDPEFDEAARLLQGRRVKLAKVDATEEKDLASRFNVKGFPTLVWFESGAEMEYDGGRTANTIVEWITSMVGDAVTVTSSLPAPGEKPIIVLHADQMNPGFEEAAKANRRKAVWYHVKASGSERVAITHKGEEPVELTGSLDEAKISAFLDENALPLYGQMDGDSFDKYLASGRGLVWSMFPSEGRTPEKVGEQTRQMMAEVAKKIKGRYHVTYTDTDNLKELISNTLGVAKFPAIAVQKKAGDKKHYVFTGGMTAPAISKFIADVDAGRVKPTLKSEPPAIGVQGPVKVVVGTTMERELFSPTRDVMLQVYAPWCGHCKKLDKEYVRLAEKVKEESLTDLVTIAKMDGTLNDSPVDSIEWTGFPHILFAKAGSRDVMIYDGERTSKGLWKYIKKHASHAEMIKDRLAKKTGKKHNEM